MWTCGKDVQRSVLVWCGGHLISAGGAREATACIVPLE